jgi:hypothetical protein
MTNELSSNDERNPNDKAKCGENAARYAPFASVPSLSLCDRRRFGRPLPTKRERGC